MNAERLIPESSALSVENPDRRHKTGSAVAERTIPVNSAPIAAGRNSKKAQVKDGNTGI